MTLEDAQKRVEELLTEVKVLKGDNQKLKNRIDLLERTMYDEVIGDYEDYEDDGDDYFEYEKYSD